MNIIINRFKVEIKDREIPLYLHFDDQFSDINKIIWERYKPSRLLDFVFIKDSNDDNLKKKIDELKKEKIKEETYVYISFYDKSEDEIEIDITKDRHLLKKWLKETTIKKLKNYFIIEPYKEGCDLSLYEENGSFNDDIKRYIRYDLVFNVFGEQPNIELSLSIGSRDTYIGYIETNEHFSNIKVLFNNLLVKREENFEKNLSVKFSKDLRTKYGIKPHPIQQFYKEDYEKIKKCIESISILLKEEITIYPTFIRKTYNEIKLVDFENNKMIFRDNQKDYSTINGMRDYGPYKIPDNVTKTQLLFIYPDSESANKLAKYFARGFRHFPGLESYVGIPANFFGIKIKYNRLDEIIESINQKLPNPNYDNILAICIMPFAKSNATEEESKRYFEIKKILLEKGVPSQFIERDNIFKENFHFSLPNIAIAMLTKIGGIPWKLARKHYNQLTIGFNVYRMNNNTYLGSTVYFDNEGIIKNINFSKSNNVNTIIEQLSNAIDAYKKESNTIEKVVIHYYKPINEKENKNIEKSLTENIGTCVSFCIVEINDTKTSTDLCFDLDYERYMPQSGIYVKLKPNEYLLFNNLRYWEKPENPIRQEEYPVKLRIFDPGKSFNYEDIISQVYEFSRLYWKSLKQKAQPVTIIYSKLIAEYMANFGLENLPENQVAKKTVWFI